MHGFVRVIHKLIAKITHRRGKQCRRCTYFYILIFGFFFRAHGLNPVWLQQKPVDVNMPNVWIIATTTLLNKHKEANFLQIGNFVLDAAAAEASFSCDQIE